jgi:uncharacterized membrane protein
MASGATTWEGESMTHFGPDLWLFTLLSIAVTLAIPVAIIWLIVVLSRRSGDGARRYDPAAEQLRYRYARGEITEAEFERGMHLLGYERVPRT